MSITASHIKLLAAERMSDATDGGGRMTATEIVSGAMNNIFPKVSRTDAVYGRVNLRKIYAAVQSATLDMYGGAHAILADAADDAKIACALFSTASAFDTRAEARNRIESYVVAAGLSRMRIYGNQVQGAKAITVYQRVEEPLPEFGVLCLSVEASGYTPAQQFVRITDMAHEVRTFTDGNTTDFERRVIVLSISSPLAQLFPGNEPVRTSDLAPTKIRSTVIADASKYYGIQPVTASVPANALDANVASVYGALVPSTNREVPISNAEIGGALVLQESGADVTGVTLMNMVLSGAAISFTLPTAIKQGTWRNSSSVYTDNGKGSIIRTSDAVVVGSIDYAQGTVAFLAGLSGSLIPHYTPAAQLGQPAHTHALDVTLATRGTIYVQTLNPLPARGTVSVSYRALGRWYTLQDDGNGVLAADSAAIGTGTVNYITGAVVVTLGALPDIDSAITFAWGSPIHTVKRAGATSDAGAATLTITIPPEDLPLQGVSVSVIINAAQVTATGSGGIITPSNGVGGSYNAVTGVVKLVFTGKLPDFGTTVTVTPTQTIEQSAGPNNGTSPIRDLMTPLAGGVGSTYSFAIADAIKPGTATFEFSVESPATGGLGRLHAIDNGAGRVVVDVGGWMVTAFLSDSYHAATQIDIGSINYSTGAVVITMPLALPKKKYDPYTKTWDAGTLSLELATGLNASLRYTADVTTTTSAATPVVETIGQPYGGSSALCVPTIDLTTTLAHPVVPGSVLFTLTGRHYWDRNGTLYTRISPSDVNETIAGSIDYQTGICSLSIYANNVTIGLVVRACLTAYGEFTAIEADFRTVGSPLRPASAYLQATTLDGELITGTCDSNGVISGAAMRGQVNQAMGVVHVEFGAMVTAAGLELEPWYVAGNVVGGMIFKPREILPSTLRYSTVVLTNLPLDPTLLGLDPVRLPMDGRVPLYRPGDIVVLHHTDTTALPNPVSAGQTYSLGRTDLASVSLTDSAGTPVLDAEWSVDLAAGSVTIASGALLAGLTQPLLARHRIEQMTLATDVQVSGLVGFAAPITREFPAGSLLSSALMFGDLVARVSNVFDQATWTSVWSDTLIGSQATAQYNDIAYPILVLNDGALTERWRINFTSATAFAVIGENTGQIATGTTSADVAINNPLTGKPYFTLRAAGWGAGWATGNQLRFNTYGANAPIWIARTILGGATLDGDAFTVEMRGDTD